MYCNILIHMFNFLIRNKDAQKQMTTGPVKEAMKPYTHLHTHTYTQTHI